jgi:hypothetical protein
LGPSDSLVGLLQRTQTQEEEERRRRIERECVCALDFLEDVGTHNKQQQQQQHANHPVRSQLLVLQKLGHLWSEVGRRSKVVGCEEL